MVVPQPINFDQGLELAINATPEAVAITLNKTLKSVVMEEWGNLRVEPVEHFSGSAYSLMLQTDRGGGSIGLIFLGSHKGGTLLRVPPGRGSTAPFTSFAMDPNGVLFWRYFKLLVENFVQLMFLEVDWDKRWLGLGLLASGTVMDNTN